jgi:hypothetical protein
MQMVDGKISSMHLGFPTRQFDEMVPPRINLGIYLGSHGFQGMIIRGKTGRMMFHAKALKPKEEADLFFASGGAET